MREDVRHGAGHGTGAMAGMADGLYGLIRHNGLIRLNGQTRHNGQIWHNWQIGCIRNNGLMRVDESRRRKLAHSKICGIR